MQYVVCLATVNRVVEEDKNGREVYKRHVTSQFVRCADADETRIMAERMNGYQHMTTAIPGVKVWNGKGFTFMSFDDVAQVYDEMTGGRAKQAAE